MLPQAMSSHPAGGRRLHPQRHSGRVGYPLGDAGTADQPRRGAARRGSASRRIGAARSPGHDDASRVPPRSAFAVRDPLVRDHRTRGPLATPGGGGRGQPAAGPARLDARRVRSAPSRSSEPRSRRDGGWGLAGGAPRPSGVDRLRSRHRGRLRLEPGRGAHGSLRPHARRGGSPAAAARRCAPLRGRYRLSAVHRVRARAPSAPAMERGPAGTCRRTPRVACSSASPAITTGTTASTASGACSAGARSRTCRSPWLVLPCRRPVIPSGSASKARWSGTSTSTSSAESLRLAGEAWEALAAILGGSTVQKAGRLVTRGVPRGPGGVLLGAAARAGARPLGRRPPAQDRRLPTARLLRAAPGRGPATPGPARGARSGARLRRAQRAGDAAAEARATCRSTRTAFSI